MLTIDSTVITLDDDGYTWDGSEPPPTSFTTYVHLQQTLMVTGGARVVIAKEDN